MTLKRLCYCIINLLRRINVKRKQSKREKGEKLEGGGGGGGGRKGKENSMKEGKGRRLMVWRRRGETQGNLERGPHSRGRIGGDLVEAGWLAAVLEEKG